MSVRRYERIDFAPSSLPSPETTAEGFMRVHGRVARTGIQEYHDAMGGIRRELRVPEEVKASVPGFSRAPLTNSHPPSMVTPENASKYVSGAVGDATFNQDGWVTAPLTIYTKDAIEAVKAGRAQLSVGYSCEVIDDPGVWEGERYDGRQTKIVVNHVALVDAARAGPHAHIRLDSGDAVTAQLWDSENGMIALQKDMPTLSTGDNAMATRFAIDGLEIEVADANARSIIERAIQSARKDAEEKLAAEKLRADTAEAGKAEAIGQLTALQAKLDCLADQVKADAGKMMKCDECGGSKTVDGVKCDGCEGTGEVAVKADRADSIQRMIAREGRKRAALLAQAGKVLSANEKLDDKSDSDIKLLVLKKLRKEVNFDGQSAGYIATRFDVEMDLIKEAAVSPVARARNVTSVVVPAVVAKPSRSDGWTEDAIEAKQKMIERRNALFRASNGK